MVFSMDKGMFSYNVSFESNGVKLDNTDDFIDREAIQPLSLKSNNKKKRFSFAENMLY